MRKIYIAVAAFFVINILLFISAFIYLDKEKHRVFQYIINIDGYDAGSVKIDKYVTDEKIIYRTISSTPFSPEFTNYKSRIDLDRKYNLKTYSKELSGDGRRETHYIEKEKGPITYVSTFDSKFLYADKMPAPKNVFVFDESAAETYIPIIDNYDFKKGRAQGFAAITVFSPAFPPMARYVTLTSINDEFIKVGSRLIKTEHLLLKIRNYPKGDVWVSKSDRSLILADIPHLKLNIRRTFVPAEPEVKASSLKGASYTVQDVQFKNKGISLSGTLTIPEKDEKLPGVLLAGGLGRETRNYRGLFKSVAHYLSNNGYIVLRFDKRGAGASSGDALAVTNSDDIEDLSYALDFLAKVPNIDTRKIALIGHAEGGLYAIATASKDERVKSLILMAPEIRPGSIYTPPFSDVKNMAARLKWSENYLDITLDAISKTVEMVKGSNRDWVMLLRNRCFLKKIREELGLDPMPMIKSVKAPTLILQGKEDEAFFRKSAANLDLILNESQSPRHSLIYFDYLGRFFGKKVADGEHGTHYEIASEAAESIKDWLDKSFEEAPAPLQADKDNPVVPEKSNKI